MTAYEFNYVCSPGVGVAAVVVGGGVVGVVDSLCSLKSHLYCEASAPLSFTEFVY